MGDLAYSEDNNGYFWSHTANRLWHLTSAAQGAEMAASLGVPQDMIVCPEMAGRQFYAASTSPRFQPFALVTGSDYAMTFTFPAGFVGSSGSFALTYAAWPATGNKALRRTGDAILPSDAVIIADANEVEDGAVLWYNHGPCNVRWTALYAAPWLGQNEVYVDGHAEWVPLNNLAHLLTQGDGDSYKIR